MAHQENRVMQFEANAQILDEAPTSATFSNYSST